MPERIRITSPAPSILVIAIDRAHKRNAVDRDTATELHRAFVDFASDDQWKVAILTGSGGSFCAGADLGAIQAGRGNVLDPDMDTMGPMGPTRLSLRKPVIAAIEGYAVAGGLELACWCDIRVAAADARLGVLCRLRGVPLIDGGTVRLPALIGVSRAMDLVLTGRLITAKEAHEMGLVSHLSAPGAALDRAIELAHQLIAHPQTCMLNDRASLLASSLGHCPEDAGTTTTGANEHNVQGRLRADMAREFELGLHSLAALQSQGQIQAFLEKRGAKM
ncbi:uncharacterized protein PFL1_03490 [Pseudozyma flocculosa PF-1]|uniref:Related to enoyl-coa hydratase protein 3 n=2 Tax=Pseudozyma flocculosa TaxID=84751 RepID=A0A5C3FCU0_9BASI|nr:uncharacterized protein PFL1_03490 [Pseudozyma flocculosa PF-1]EPQ29203.1 hypothetical protein PFL1_03490 [Pseudozyma flocculosa PF-1]SPO41495.1 related to enoyl-coa hydratase protein 3 [Pseudozyma flocculosa]